MEIAFEGDPIPDDVIFADLEGHEVIPLAYLRPNRSPHLGEDDILDGEIADVLSRVDGLIAWAEKVREYALREALNGKRFTGWKLVAGRSSRRFTDDEAVRARIEAAGFDPYERKKKSLTAIEQLMGKKEFDKLLSDLVVRETGKPILVPEHDKRPEYVPAKVEFTDNDDGCESAEE